MLARDLVALLLSLPESATVIMNAVGNIAVLDEHHEFIGWIDLSDGTYNGRLVGDAQ